MGKQVSCSVLQGSFLSSCLEKRTPVDNSCKDIKKTPLSNQDYQLSRKQHRQGQILSFYQDSVVALSASAQDPSTRKATINFCVGNFGAGIKRFN